LPEQITTETSFEERVKDVVRDVFKDVLSLPEEFRSWIPYWVEQYGVLIPRGQVLGSYTTAESVAELGEPAHGRPVTLRAGSSPYYFVQFTYDEVYGKWVSTAHWTVGQIGTYTFSNTDYLPATVGEVGYVMLPGFKAIYDAGARPQVSVVGQLDNSDAGTTFIQANIREFASGDTGFNEIGTGGEISHPGTTATIKWSDWSTVTFGSITDANAVLTLANKVSSGTGTVERASVNLRWVADPA
jgi:hypothetical protein